LQAPEIECISIKISTLYSQISALAREDTVATLCERLELLYRTAAHARFRRPDGTEVPKFVYLDMEEYRDLGLTAEVFMRTLDRPGLRDVHAGIVLQAYIPDSYRYQRELTAWARQRVAGGGAPITLRLVKGANMESERCEASLKDWPQAPYRTKRETDANFKRMVDHALDPANIAAVRVGIASPTCSDLAYPLVLAVRPTRRRPGQFEMLEGMANPQRRALFELTPNLLLYAPVCARESFLNAIGYLIRRLDENTGPENFLRHAFRITPDSPEWQRLERGFLDAFALVASVSDAPRRTQNRLLPPPPADALAGGWQRLANEPDTDFALPHNGTWAQQIVARWQPLHGDHAAEIPLVIAGEEIFDGRPCRDSLDPSRPGVVVAHYRQASEADIDRAVDCAGADPADWRTLPTATRYALLGRVAVELRSCPRRVVANPIPVGRAWASSSSIAPPRVGETGDTRAPKGVAVVVSPWNFRRHPAAAAAAGYRQHRDQAGVRRRAGRLGLCRCFWRASVPRKAAVRPRAGGHEGRRLVSHRQSTW
jgi:RHH-type proline utilization regulon transcriptional repressor/proline dehydrogenase/delta 1-pyrroline-5-carboxylate dehydrogenase